MGRLTTHILDTALGRPAGGLKIELWSLEENPSHIKTVVTNHDGRVDAPLLDGEEFKVGQYELRFHAGAYLKSTGASLSEPPFLDVIPLRFGIANKAEHYHVPLLLSPYGYSTYRGS
ncbi:hydroxyisourate hydrolase [Nordella sp. HKS 07]|uniref:hydroxyisourate hydrolase n=1 Tax=Nordella sp. HKS 07 TaxID=2712222 RepID=UPI0013E1CB6C|nr:hydroxyisourate hydrolase [Nordella sp. HKS 07]QIG49673.1 hydroxyisourate hydrolase [Nordella sp. HKS 07]